MLETSNSVEKSKMERCEVEEPINMLEQLSKEVQMLTEEKANLLGIQETLWTRIHEEIEEQKKNRDKLKQEIEELRLKCEKLAKALNSLRQA